MRSWWRSVTADWGRESLLEELPEDAAACRPTAMTGRKRPRSRQLRRIAACVALLSVPLVLLAGEAAVTAAPTTLTWSAPESIDNQYPFVNPFGFDSLSCSTTTLCVGTTGQFNSEILSSTNPASSSPSAWSVLPTTLLTQTATGYSLDGASCVTAGAGPFCLTAGSNFEATTNPGLTLTSTDPTSTSPGWTPTSLPDDLITAPSCAYTAPTTICIAVASGDPDDTLEVSSNPTGGAASWHSITTVLGSIAAATCQSSTFCAAIESDGAYVFATGDPTNTNDWSTASAATGLDDATSLTCPAIRICLAFGQWNDGPAVATTHEADVSGSSWSDQNPTGLTGASGPMPCFEGVNSEIVCLLAGPNDVLVSTDGGADWAAQSIGGSVPDTPTAFSCPATNLCLGGTQGGAVISSTTFTDGTSGIWSAPVPVAGGASPVQISAQSCAFASLCLASDGVGRILTSTNPAGGASTWTSGIADPGQNITTLDCPSLSLCVATGQDLTGNFGNKVLVSANPAGGAGTWSSGSPISADEEPIENLACPSVSLCVAVNTNGDVMSTTQPTDTASWTQPQQIVNAEAIYRLQCPSTTLCVATDSDGGVASSTNPGAGGSSWLARQTIDTTDSDLEGLQCPSPSLCVAVDSEGNVLASTDPGTASTWSTPTSIDPIGLDDLQCPSTSLCVAVDFNGDVLTSTNPAAGAGSWSKPVSIDPSPILALLCFESGQCGAVDETGAVVYSTDPAGGASEWSAPTKIDSAGATTSGGAACPTLTLCVLSDSLGNVIVGTVPSANPSTPPGSSTPTSPSTTPSVTAGSPVVKGQGAGFSGSVDPNGLASTAHFEYGLDPEYTGGGPIVYTNVTPTVSVGSGSAAVPVNQSVSGLVPNARYHVRLVASNSAGTATGPDQAFMTAKLPNPPSPVLGQDENVVPVSGRVFIKFPPGKDPHLAGVVKGQGFIPLTQARQVPVGSQVDARRGTLDLVVATTKKRRSSTARLAGGVFSLAQQRTGPLKGLATFSLLENAFPGAPSYSSCTIKKTGKSVLAGVAKLNPKVLQTLTASDNNGKFRTKGRYSAATVRGTFWETEDRCDGTLTIVKRGSVNVQDFKTRKTIIVRAGHSFLAAAATSPKPTKKKKRK